MLLFKLLKYIKAKSSRYKGHDAATTTTKTDDENDHRRTDTNEKRINIKPLPIHVKHSAILNENERLLFFDYMCGKECRGKKSTCKGKRMTRGFIWPESVIHSNDITDGFDNEIMCRALGKA